MVRFRFPGLLFALLAFALIPTTADAAENYEIDGGHSMMIFKVSHFGVSNSIGRFNDISGMYTLDGAKSSFDVTIKADSVDTGHGKRDTHLKSPDFFNSKQFPVITLTSKSVAPAGDKKFTVKGELTLHGVTKEISFDIEQIGAGDDPWGNYRSGFETMFTIKRSDFGMKFMPEGIGDEVTIMVTIEGIRK